MDRYRCREVDGVGGRCQLIVGYNGQHVLQRDGASQVVRAVTRSVLACISVVAWFARSADPA
jgi:hypothetical protein